MYRNDFKHLDEFKIFKKIEIFDFQCWKGESASHPLSSLSEEGFKSVSPVLRCALAQYSSIQMPSTVILRAPSALHTLHIHHGP